MGVIRSFRRFFKVVGYLVIGKTDRARLILAKNPDAIRGGYNEVIQEKTQYLKQCLDVIQAQVASRNDKIERLEKLQEKHQELVDGQTGALTFARQRVAELEAALGHTPSQEELKSDIKYSKFRTAYTNKAHAIDTILGRIEEIESTIGEHTQSINTWIERIHTIRSEIRQLADEREDAIADILQANADQQTMAQIANIPIEDRTLEKLSMLREIRAQARASAQVAHEVVALGSLEEPNSLDFEKSLIKEGKVDVAGKAFDALMGVVDATEIHGTEKLDLGLPVEPKSLIQQTE